MGCWLKETNSQIVGTGGTFTVRFNDRATSADYLIRTTSTIDFRDKTDIQLAVMTRVAKWQPEE